MTTRPAASLALAMRFGAAMLLICYLYVLVKIILFKFGQVSVLFLGRQLIGALERPGNMLYRWHAANLTPFRSISMYLERLDRPYDIVNLFGNIALFVPLGVFVALLAGCGWRGAAIRAFGVSLALECAQIVFMMGSFDVDDLILNTLGGLVGYGMCRMLAPGLSGGGAGLGPGEGPGTSRGVRQEAAILDGGAGNG
ncbi:VanZ family protein [Cohnella hashimotonis]|uniref:VanZ family protein n=1 Tax=Cohnella hashimotonis TaxID=2826895 RepID=A0ABT6TJ85_9BACL|nr:VanZ family protein [Cohnella hashimotonis]MDI4646909.1 VanZ family protein [Cohnella hashimotonis]